MASVHKETQLSRSSKKSLCINNAAGSYKETERDVERKGEERKKKWKSEERVKGRRELESDKKEERRVRE